MVAIDYPPLVYAFSGNEEAAREALSRLFNPDSDPSRPQSMYLAQGDSSRALKANTSFYFAQSGATGGTPWLERHFLRQAYELAPEAPLIALRYARHAEPDIRKAIDILNGLDFLKNQTLRGNLEFAKSLMASYLAGAERGEWPFILEYRTKRP